MSSGRQYHGSALSPFYRVTVMDAYSVAECMVSAGDVTWYEYNKKSNYHRRRAHPGPDHASLRALRLESDCGPFVHIFTILTLLQYWPYFRLIFTVTLPLCLEMLFMYLNKQAHYRRQSALQKYNCEKRASNIALSYGVDVDKWSFECFTSLCLWVLSKRHLPGILCDLALPSLNNLSYIGDVAFHKQYLQRIVNWFSLLHLFILL